MDIRNASQPHPTPPLKLGQLLLYAALSALLPYAGAAILLLFGQPG